MVRVAGAASAGPCYRLLHHQAQLQQHLFKLVQPKPPAVQRGQSSCVDALQLFLGYLGGVCIAPLPEKSSIVEQVLRAHKINAMMHRNTISPHPINTGAQQNLISTHSLQILDFTGPLKTLGVTVKKRYVPRVKGLSLIKANDVVVLEEVGR